MNTNRIDFISAYCDRWCERCAFTDRCSAYACHVAIAMCGDCAQGIELAVGVPQPVGEERQETAGERLMREIPQPSAEEIDECARADEARHARLDAAPLTRMARTYMMRSTDWLDEHREPVVATADSIVRDAIEIVGWDAYLIGAKLHRALDGRDRFRDGEDEGDDDPVQNDSNGSAKVALISLERSETAWRAIAGAGVGDVPCALAEALSQLRRLVEIQFPRAAVFMRPGFDEPWR